MVKLRDVVPAGVITGGDVVKLFEFAKKAGFAIPAINCTSSSTVNAALESARENNSPLIIQFSQGGSSFYAGKGFNAEGKRADVIGSVAGALHVRQMAKHYGIPVILHTDHCHKKHIDWLEGLIEEDAAYAEKNNGIPLYSSHMIDYSAEPDEENIAKTVEILEKCAPLGIFVEMEIGVTGGEEDGVNNEGVDNTKLYSTPEDVLMVYKALSKVKNGNFSIAAAFGNVHGVYKVNAALRPEMLKSYQEAVSKHLGGSQKNPLFLVFHGGSGSKPDVINEAVSYGVIKMNIDTDTQWAYWKGVHDFEEDKRDRLQQQVGTPAKSLDDDDQPNKKYYDPRVWIRKAEQNMSKRLGVAFSDLNATNSLDLEYSA